MITLAGKKALITGATGAIGLAIAQKFHALGATVILTGTRAERLQQIHATLKNSHFITGDLSDPEQVKTMIFSIEEQFGTIDILVNNAGITADGLCLRMKDQDWDQVLQVNLKSAFVLSRDCVKSMIKRRNGRIINITSVVAVTGNPGQANYCAAKAGMIGMSKAIAMEIATRGITVNCIAPGFIDSEMTRDLNEKQREAILQQIPQSRMGEAEDIASAAAFLASDEAKYITGQTLHVNGGLAMI